MSNKIYVVIHYGDGAVKGFYEREHALKFCQSQESEGVVMPGDLYISECEVE